MIEPTWTSDCCTVRLWNRCCLEVMASWPDGAVDAVVTDPPYGEAHASGWHGKFRGHMIANDDSTFARDAVLQAWQGPAAVFGKWSVPKWGQPRGVLVWDKGPASGMGDLSFPWKPSWEDVAIYGVGWRGDRDEGVLKGHSVVTWSGKGQRQHPNEKPVSLLECIIGKHSGHTIADPFMGSGTTGVAAVRLGRQFWGCEIDPEYFEVAKRRIQDELRRAAFLEGRASGPRQTMLPMEASCDSQS